MKINAIRGELTGSRVFPPRFANTCWSLIDTDDGVKVGANCKAGEDADLRKATYQESEGWYAGITADMFG